MVKVGKKSITILEGNGYYQSGYPDYRMGCTQLDYLTERSLIHKKPIVFATIQLMKEPS